MADGVHFPRYEGKVRAYVVWAYVIVPSVGVYLFYIRTGDTRFIAVAAMWFLFYGGLFALVSFARLCGIMRFGTSDLHYTVDDDFVYTCAGNHIRGKIPIGKICMIVVMRKVLLNYTTDKQAYALGMPRRSYDDFLDALRAKTTFEVKRLGFLGELAFPFWRLLARKPQSGHF